MLTNKLALVTGASRGIGKAIAIELAKQGAMVLGTSTSQAGADKITELLTQLGVNGAGLVLDVSDPTSIESLLTVIQQEWELPAILVNNAGITRDNLLLRMKEDEWQSIIDTNLTAVYRMTKACLKGMMKQRFGRIINISSVVALSGNPGQVNYAAAKAGVIGFSKSLAQELGGRGITVNVVAPGFIETEMTQNIPEQHREMLMSRIPLKRLGQSEEVAHLVSFLASPSAGYITGETININGGLYMA